jgi:hypothetical protein
MGSIEAGVALLRLGIAEFFRFIDVSECHPFSAPAIY